VSGSSNTTSGGIFRPLVPPPGGLLWRMLEPRPHATAVVHLSTIQNDVWLSPRWRSWSSQWHICLRTHTSPQNTSLSLHLSLFTGHHVLGVQYITSLKSYLCTAVKSRNAENCTINSKPKDTTALKSNVFFNWNTKDAGHTQVTVLYLHSPLLAMSKPFLWVYNSTHDEAYHL
jgi:hypothetical protein